MRLWTLAAGVAAIALLAGCNRQEAAKPAAPPPAAPAQPPAPKPAETALSGFHHSGTSDNSGYYLPAAEVRAGNWKLNHMAVGAISDFAQWEQGDRTSVFGPILLSFDDTTSPTAPNELGGEAHTVNVRVLPSAYQTDGRTIRFAGQDAKLGKVTLEGRFDAAALAAAKAEGAGGQAVLTGDLTVGDRKFANVTFTFFAGD